MIILTTSIKYLVVFTLFIFLSEISIFKKMKRKERKQDDLKVYRTDHCLLVELKNQSMSL